MHTSAAEADFFSSFTTGLEGLLHPCDGIHFVFAGAKARDILSAYGTAESRALTLVSPKETFSQCKSRHPRKELNSNLQSSAKNSLVLQNIRVIFVVREFSCTRPLGRVFVFLGCDPSADGREVAGIAGIADIARNRRHRKAMDRDKGSLIRRRGRLRSTFEWGKCEMVGFAGLGPSPPTPPLVQDDRRRRGEFTPRSFIGFGFGFGIGFGFGFGWPLGGPSVAQGPRKVLASVEWGKLLCLQQKTGKGREGVVIAGIARDRRHRRDRKSKFLPLICTDNTDREKD